MTREIEVWRQGQLLGTFHTDTQFGANWLLDTVIGDVSAQNAKPSGIHYSVDADERLSKISIRIVPYGQEAITIQGEAIE
jgi:hypothetical protein